MNKMTTLLGFMTMILLVCMNTHAIYDEMSVQGKLKNTSTGDAMVGDYAFSFNIYSAYTGGGSLYEHNETLTTDSNGIYNTILTSVDLPFNVNYYLGVNINDTGEMSPRVNMTDVGNAMRSNETEYFNNHISSYYLNTSTSFEGDISGTYDAISLDTDTVSDDEIDYSTVTLNDFTNDASFVTTSDDSVSSSELDNICNTNDRILLRAAGSWGCFDYSVWATDSEVTTANTSMKNYVDARDSLQDSCSEITGCIENAITDGNTNWDNSYGYFDDITNFTGTLTDTKWCIYDSANTEIDCNVEPVTNTDTQDLSYDTGTDVISLVDGGSIDITEVDTNTNANTECSGTTTYYDGEGNCDDISSVYALINYGDNWNKTYADTLYRLETWDNFTGIPTAAPTDGDTTHLSTADQIRDYVIGLGYSTTTGTVTSVATDDTYLTGGAITSTGTITFSTALAGTDLAVNSSDYWDNLGSPSDINAGDIINDGTYRLDSWDNFTGIPTATPSNGDTTHASTADQIYDFVIALNYKTLTEIVTNIGNWSADKSSYWDTSNDLDTVISDDEIVEGKIAFSTACAAGNHYYLNGNDLACEADDDTTYTAGAGLVLTDTTFTHNDSSSQASSDNSGRTYIQDITLDTYGHIQTIVTATETVTNTDTQDLSYTAATDVISLVDGGSIDITEVDTSANTICSGGTTYLDGDGNCDDISSVYAPINYGDDWNKTYADTLFQPLETTLTDIADGTINENLVNTANPWADNEVSDTLTCSNLVSASAVVDISTETNLAVGNGITLSGDTLTVTGGTAITADAGGVSITAGAIGDTQLAFNTGQHLTTASNPTFQNVTVEEIKFENDATNHRIYDNTTCIIIKGDTSTWNIC